MENTILEISEMISNDICEVSMTLNDSKTIFLTTNDTFKIGFQSYARHDTDENT